jgi:hypothetical protein
MTKTKSIIVHHQNHRILTRRDLLGLGYINMASFLAMPSLISLMMSQRAEAEGCQTNISGGPTQPAFICIDLAGGANIAGSNVIVGKKEGQEDFLSDYSTIGLPKEMFPQNSNQVNSELGLKFHADSAILKGILGDLAIEVRANVEGAVFCTSSSDDTANNEYNPMHWIYKTGSVGSIVPLIGTMNSASGGTSKAIQESIESAIKPIKVASPAEATALVDPGTLFPKDSKTAEKVMKAIARMSATEIKKLDNKSMHQQIKELLSCGYLKSSDLISKYTAASVDPVLDQNISSVFNMQLAMEKQAGTVAKMVLDGYAGTGTIQLGGYDYHDNTRSTGETKDTLAGSLIGKLITAASLKNRDLVIYVYTDGGVTSKGSIDASAGGGGKLRWTGDSGQRSAAFMLVYKKDGKPKLRSKNRQIGSYKDNGSVNNESGLTASSPANLGKVIIANYLALQGREGEFDKIVKNNPFSRKIDDYLLFEK